MKGRKKQDIYPIDVKRGEQWAYRSPSGGHESHVKILGVSRPTAYVVGGGTLTAPASCTFREVTRTGANKGRLLQDRDSKGRVKKKIGYTHMLRLEDGVFTMGPGWRRV